MEAAAPSEGALIGLYRLLVRLERGGEALWYSAVDTATDEPVVLECLFVPNYAAHARALAEAKALAQIRHPGIAVVRDAVAHGQWVCLARAPLQGLSLPTWLKRATRQPSEVLHAFIEAGRGLAAAHRAGLVHRAFSAEHLIVDGEGHARVDRFDLAHQVLALEAGAPPALEAAPELLEGLPPSQATDQFAFCAHLADALLGAPPYQASTIEALRALHSRGPPRLSSVGDAVSPRVLRALERGLSPRPEKRWPSMEALLAQLADEPASRARRVVLSTAPAVALVGLLLWLGLRGDPEVTPRSPPPALAAAWSGELRARVERHFARAGRPALGKEVSARVDAFVRSYVPVADDVVPVPEPCVRRAAAQLSASVRSLLSGEARLGAAQALLAHLPPPALCDAAELAISPAEARQHDRLTRLQVLVSAQRPEKGLEAARAALAEARQSGARRLEAQSALYLAQLHVQRLGDEEDSAHVAQAKEAFLAASNAAEAARALDLVVRARIGLSDLLLDAGQRDESQQWLRSAGAALEAVRGHDADLVWRYELAQGRAANLTSRLSEGERFVRRALSSVQRAWGEGHLLEAEVREELGSLLHQQGRYDEAITEGRKALELYVRYYGAEDDRVQAAFETVALEQRRLERNPDALELLQRLLSLQREGAEGAIESGRMQVLLTEARIVEVLSALGRFDEAQRLGRDVLARVDALEDATPRPKVEVLALIARAELAAQRVIEARDLTRRALEVARRTSADPELEAELLTQLGHIELARGAPQTSVALLARAVRMLSRSEDSRSLARAELGLAEALWHWRRDKRRARLLAGRARDSLAQEPMNADLRRAEALLETLR